jgi:hypothetical protein
LTRDEIWLYEWAKPFGADSGIVACNMRGLPHAILRDIRAGRVEPHRRLATDKAPRFTEQELKSVLEANTCIVRDPAPFASLKVMDGVAVEAELHFRVDSLAIGTTARNEIIHLLYYRCRQNSLTLAKPSRLLVQNK